ncbi:hypothetical protein GCM10027597_17450 [Saccharopolyspora tripterygii]
MASSRRWIVPEAKRRFSVDMDLVSNLLRWLAAARRTGADPVRLETAGPAGTLRNSGRIGPSDDDAA